MYSKVPLTSGWTVPLKVHFWSGFLKGQGHEISRPGHLLFFLGSLSPLRSIFTHRSISLIFRIFRFPHRSIALKKNSGLLLLKSAKKLNRS